MSRRAALSAVMLLALLSAGCSGGDASMSAKEQVPALAAGLARVDAALAAHEFAAARKDLRKLRGQVVAARRSDDLRPSDATRVLDAIARLLATIPADPTGPTTSPVPQSASATPSARPTHRRPKATGAATPSPTAPAPTPSSSPTPTEPTPSPSGTAGPSPTAAAATATP